MSRVIATFSVALACAIAVHAQDSNSKTKVEVKGNKADTVTYTGCLQAGSETRSFVLANVVPVGKTTTTQVGTSGATTTTTTTYALVPGEKVEFQQHVG